MISRRFQFIILFLTMTIDMLSFGILLPILPRYAEQLKAVPWQIGLLVGIFSLAQWAMLPLLGTCSDRFGRRPLLLISIFGSVLAYLLMGWAHSIFILLLGRALDGASGGNISIIQAYLSDITGPEERSQTMGLLGAAYGFGMVVGPALGGWSSYFYGPSTTMFLGAGLAFINFLVVFFFLPEPLVHKHLSHQKLSLFAVLKHIDKKIFFSVIGISFFMLAGHSLLLTLLPLIAYHRYHLNEQQTGFIYLMAGVIAIVVEGGGFGLFAKHFKDHWMITAGCISMMLALFLFSSVSELSIALCLFGMMALGDSLITPALPATISRHVGAAWQGAALGIFQSAASLARFIGPLVAGCFLKWNLHTPVYGQVACWVAAGFLFFSFLCSLNLNSIMESRKFI